MQTRTKFGSGLLCCIVAGSFLAPSAIRCQADGLIFRLPQDGSWVEYKMQQNAHVKVTYPDDAEVPAALRTVPAMPISTKGTLRLSSVGIGEVNGEPARWIELHIQAKGQGKMPTPKNPKGEEQEFERQIVLKMLIPEKYLAEGEDPFAHVATCYFKDGDREPHRITEEKRKQYEIDRFRPWFPESPKSIDSESDQVLETEFKEAERLNCRNITFASSYEGPLSGGERGWWSWNGTHDLWLDPVTPFGVASLLLNSTSDEWSGMKKGDGVRANMVGTGMLTLSGFGTGAKSRLPELH